MLSTGKMAISDLGLSALRFAEREALLTGALLCLEDADSLLRPEPDWQDQHAIFMEALSTGECQQ